MIMKVEYNIGEEYCGSVILKESCEMVALYNDELTTEEDVVKYINKSEDKNMKNYVAIMTLEAFENVFKTFLKMEE